MSDLDNSYMRRALTLAEAAIPGGDLPIAAILVHDDRVVAQAHNMVAAKGHDLLAHAEMLVIQGAMALQPRLKIAQRREMTLYTTLEPCMMCFGAVMNLNIGRICYALESPGDGVLPIVHQWEKKSEQLPFYRAPVTVPGVLRHESGRLFRAFATDHPKSRFAAWTKQLAELVGA